MPASLNSHWHIEDGHISEFREGFSQNFFLPGRSHFCCKSLCKALEVRVSWNKLEQSSDDLVSMSNPSGIWWLSLSIYTCIYIHTHTHQSWDSGNPVLLPFWQLASFHLPATLFSSFFSQVEYVSWSFSRFMYFLLLLPQYCQTSTMIVSAS